MGTLKLSIDWNMSVKMRLIALVVTIVLHAAICQASVASLADGAETPARIIVRAREEFGLGLLEVSLPVLSQYEADPDGAHRADRLPRHRARSSRRRLRHPGRAPKKDGPA